MASAVDGWSNKGQATGRGGRVLKGTGGKKGYRNKSHQLEVIVRDRLNQMSKLQAEKVFLTQKGAVLEVLLEVASEIAVHKKQHTGTKFPELRDAQLLEFLEKFLEEYGGYSAERPTERNYFRLERLATEEFKDVRKEDFLAKYTSLVQRLSLLLLQATDDSMKGGLASTIDDLKQLLLGILLWSPLSFMQVGTHNLVSGDPIQPDPDHSAGCISRIHLTPEQQDVLVIIGDLYNNQVGAMEATHLHLCQQLDTELVQDNSSSLAATIMRVNSNMHRLLAIHQLFHMAIMHNLLDQQLALLCVRCFPRFPCMQDLLNALARIRDSNGTGGLSAAAAAAAAAKNMLDVPAPLVSDSPAGSGAAAVNQVSADTSVSFLERGANKPPKAPVLSSGRLADAGSKLLRSAALFSSSSLATAAAGIKDEALAPGAVGTGGTGDGSPDVAAAATAAAVAVAAAATAAAAASEQQALPNSPLTSSLADVIKSNAKDWDVGVQAAGGGRDEQGGNSTPVRGDSSYGGAAAAGGPGSSQKLPPSPLPSSANTGRTSGSAGGNSSKGNGKRPGSSAANTATGAGGYGSSSVYGAGAGGGSSAVQAGIKRSRAAVDDKWSSKQQQHGSSGKESVDMAAVAAAAVAAGMPLDPAAAAALPVPIETLPAQLPLQQQQPAGRSGGGSNLPAGLVQQLAAVLNAGGPADFMQLLATQPKLSLLLQQQPQLMGMLQEAMIQQQQQQQQQHQHSDQQQMWQQQQPQMGGLQDMGRHQQQSGYAAAAAHGRPPSSSRHWSSGSQAGGGFGAPGSGQRPNPGGMPTLEMLPPSLSVPKEPPSSTPLQGLLRSVATLLQACSNVSEAAMAASEAGQGEFVSSAVSAAEAALSTALKSLQDVKARCSTSGGGSSQQHQSHGGHSHSHGGGGSRGGGYAHQQQGGMSTAGPPPPPLSAYRAPAGHAQGGLSLHLPPAGPSSQGSRLQPPAGIPMPGPGASQQQQLPQSLSLALSGVMQAQQQQGPPSSLAFLAPPQGPSSKAGAGMHGHNCPPAGAGVGGMGPSSGDNKHGGGGSSRAMAAPSQGGQQHPAAVSSLVQQLAALGDNPATIAQVVQLLQQSTLGPEVSALLGQLVGAAAGGGGFDFSSLAAMIQQQQSGKQPVAVKAEPGTAGSSDAARQGNYPAASAAAAAAAASAGPAAAGPSSSPPPPASAAYPAAGGSASQPVPDSHDDLLQHVAALDAAVAAVSAGVPSSSAAAAAAAAAPGTGAAGAAAAGQVPAAGQQQQPVKDESPSAGSSTTNTGQSAGGDDQQSVGAAAGAAAAAADNNKQHSNINANPANHSQPGSAEQQQQRQQLEGFARSAAAAMGAQLRGPGETEAFVSTVMQLLQGQLGSDGVAAGLSSMAGVLQAMTGHAAASTAGAASARGPPSAVEPSHHHQHQHQGGDVGGIMAPGHHLDPAAAAALPVSLTQNAAAAATMIPPAAAAMMAAKQASAAGERYHAMHAAAAPAAAAGGGDFMDVDVDAVSALEMLASAAVGSQQGPPAYADGSHEQRKRSGGNLRDPRG